MLNLNNVICMQKNEEKHYCCTFLRKENFSKMNILHEKELLKNKTDD